LRRPREEALAGDEAVGHAGPELDLRQRILEVFDHVQQLDELDRSIVGLTLAQGLTPREIARALGLSPVVVRARKCRAIHRLAAEMRSAPAVHR
ncbi:MAG TPA: sigma factor-like helix-turn-helix DNA-binding protein, partial [Vicinamibacteria bacterium]|nr:sigma factor-like helix-turn-helix DNA-binding protein [Vicinamibacteria bacterium]